jgi:hypothetical protein
MRVGNGGIEVVVKISHEEEQLKIEECFLMGSLTAISQDLL